MEQFFLAWLGSQFSQVSHRKFLHPGTCANYPTLRSVSPVVP